MRPTLMSGLCASAIIEASGQAAPIEGSTADLHTRIDALELAMVDGLPPVHCPLNHTFTNGMYSRCIFMPAGSLITSKIHKTQHQFVVLQGRCSVLVAGGEWQEICAPYHGITEPGTRRVLLIHEDTLWITFHPTDKQTVEEVEADIIEPHDSHLSGLSEAQIASIRQMQTGGVACLG